ncbi:glycosyltransferase family 4 protein [Methanolobus sp. WCC4]|uniref:glycosyltransferase family 4 protein n=1 Tax=Methanolobus sp. WCC4 TaxID=3125784 RepID=UPI0030F68CA5
MNICIMCQDFPPLIGGIAAHVHELSKALAKQGNEVHVIVPRYPYNLKWEENFDGIHVHRVFQIRKRFLSGNLYIPFAIAKLLSVIKKHNIDVVHYHSSYPESIITKYIKNKPVIFTAHESGFLEMASNERFINKLKYRLSHPDIIIGPSQELADVPTKFGVDKNKTIFISNGVDVDKFSPSISGSRIREKYKVKDDEIVVLCPRRLAPKNGVIYLIEAIPQIAAINQKIKFVIVGEGGFKKQRTEMEDTLINLSLDDKVIFTGDIPNHEMPEFFAASDIVVLPSLMEATSIAGLEAMSSSKPLIGTTVGGIPYLIDDNITGILVPPKDSEALANAIDRLTKDEDMRNYMGLNARKKVETEFSWEIIAKKTLRIYEELIV